ncbi:MAG: hypothetical protein WAK29_05870 [Terriglobales bacterium]
MCTIPVVTPERIGRDGGILTVIYSTESATPRTTRTAVVLPLLVILFIVSYGILTALVFEQGQTIEAQRSLIREMLKDSTQLAALKGKIARDDGKRVQDKELDPAERKDAAPDNATSTPKRSGATGPDKQTKQSGKSARTMKVIPHKPEADLEDVRRSTGVI